MRVAPRGAALRDHSESGYLPAVVSYSPIVELFLLGGLFFLPTLAWSQAARLSVGVANTLAGDTVDIPIYLTAPDPIKVVSVVQTIRFPKKLLSLTRAQLGPAAEQSQAEIRTKTTDPSDNSDLSLIEIVISSKEPMKAGVLAYLKFKVSTAAREGAIPLKVVDLKATTERGAPLPIAKGRDGEVAVFNTTEAMPAVGCFFFTH